MRVAFMTADGLVTVADCPDIDDPEARRVMRPLWSRPEDRNFGKYRVYERAAASHQGLPLFVEINSYSDGT